MPGTAAHRTRRTIDTPARQARPARRHGPRRALIAFISYAVLTSMSTQAYAIGQPAAGARISSIDTTAASGLRDGEAVPDITALLLPTLGVLCLIARRRQSMRKP